MSYLKHTMCNKLNHETTYWKLEILEIEILNSKFQFSKHDVTIIDIENQ